MTADEIAHNAKGRFWYLGTVYTAHPLGTARAYREAVYLGAQMIRRGVNFYCPIVHWHPIALEGGVDNHHEYWMEIGAPMMNRCDGMICCMMPGHGNSRGLTHEVDAFKQQNKPVIYWRLCHED